MLLLRLSFSDIFFDFETGRYDFFLSVSEVEIKVVSLAVSLSAVPLLDAIISVTFL